MKGKVESVEKQDFVDSYGNLYYNVTIDGKKGNYSHKPDKSCYFVVGQEQEYEEEVKNDKNGNPRTKFKKPYVPFGGGGKKQIMPLTECTRIAKSNAVHAVITVNAIYEREVLKGDSLGALVAFSLAGISGDIPKWGEEHNLFISRLAAVNNAAADCKIRQYKDATELINHAEKLYKYVVG